MAKNRILFYTDCYMFGGCEKSLFEIVSHKDFNENFDYSIIYNYSSRYLDGLEKYKPNFPMQKLVAIRLPEVTLSVYNNPSYSYFRKLIIRVSFKLLRPFILIYDIVKLKKSFKTDCAKVLHINNGGYPGALSCIAATVAGKLCGKKVIMVINNTAQARRCPMDFVMDWLCKKSVDIFITGSKASGAILSQRRGMSPKKITNVYHGMRPPSIIKTETKEQICMIALLEERKGHKYAISAFKRLVNENPEFSKLKFVLIGDGPIRKELERQVSDLHLNESVEFVGYTPNYAQTLTESKFLLNPSIKNEDLPYIIIEAMSLGIPAIATAIAGIPEQITDGETGFLVEPKDIDALYHSMKKLLKDKNLREQMSKNSKRKFEKLFTLDAMVNSYLEHYKALN
jgi:glycosyltransferase involved in cell wall biosynthesis